MSPNPEIISQSKDLDVDRSSLKILLLGFFVVASSFSSFYLFQRFLLSPDIFHLLTVVFFSLIFFVFATISSFLIKSEWKLYLFSLLATIAISLIYFRELFSKSGVFVAVGLLLFFILVNAAFRSGVQSVENSLKLRFLLVAKSVTPKLVTGFILLATTILFSNYFLWNRFSEQIGRNGFNRILASGESALHLWFPSSSFDQSVDAFLKSAVRTQLKKTTIKLGLDPREENSIDFSKLAPEVQDALVGQSALSALTYFESKFGPIKKTDAVRDVFYGLVRDFVVDLSDQERLLGGALVSLAFFSGLKAIVGLFYWLINGLAFILFKLLVILGFSFVATESRTREFVLLK